MNKIFFSIGFFLISVLVLSGVGCGKNTIKIGENIQRQNLDNSKLDSINQGSVSSEPILDHGEIEATIINIYHPINPQIDYGKIRVDKIIELQHHPNANYAALAVGDEIDVYFQWGAKAAAIDESPIGPSPNDINLPGVDIGDKIRANLQGCPEEKGCGNGWTLNEYSLVN